MGVKVRVLSRPNKNFKNRQTELIFNISDKHMKAVAEETERVVKQKIAETTTRALSTGNLSNSFFMEKLQGQRGYGIGRIRFLNRQAPYWRHVNFGSKAIGARWRHRVPKGEFQPGNSAPSRGRSGQRWKTEFTVRYSFIPTKPIRPRNYIERTIVDVFPRIRSITKEVT